MKKIAAKALKSARKAIARLKATHVVEVQFDGKHAKHYAHGFKDALDWASQYGHVDAVVIRLAVLGMSCDVVASRGVVVNEGIVGCY